VSVPTLTDQTQPTVRVLASEPKPEPCPRVEPTLWTMLPSDPLQWTPEHVASWFRVHKNGRWSEFAPKFAVLSGDELCDLTERQILRFVNDDPRGAIIYNDLVKLKSQKPPQQPVTAQPPPTWASADSIQPVTMQPPRWEPVAIPVTNTVPGASHLRP
jgi:hypothetical protein